MAEHEDHTYEDKFALAEFLTGSTSRSLLDTFSRIGLSLDDDTVEEMKEKGADLFKERTVLHFDRTRKCEFLKEKHVRVEGKKSVDNTVLGLHISSTKEYHNVVEYHWNVRESYDMYACVGSCKDGGKRVPMRGRTMSANFKTTQDQEPADGCNKSQSEDVELTWFVRNIVVSGTQNFTIDRNLESCRTPRRNKEIERVLLFHKSLHHWLGSVSDLLEDIIRPKCEPMNLRHLHEKVANFQLLTFPFMENSTILPALDTELMFKHEMAMADKRIGELGDLFPSASPDTFVSIDEAALYVHFARTQAILVHYSQSMGYIEDMLRKQLIQALGKEMTPADFENHMRFHNRKFLGSEYAPQPFSHSIRPDEHQNPVGMISIETIGNHLANNEPIQTMTRRISGGEGSPPIKIPLDASSVVQITGDRYLSGWLRHQFSSVGGTGPVSLVARARQFSSFMLMVGTMTSADTFDPKHAIILQNKDEVAIPLIMNTLPSAKEFKDAISSLSPKQQEFASAFRTMQLGSSVFAVCIVQLKPQMEKLLHLPPGSLAKEIQLTEDLMSLFVDYQIPSDIVSYDESNEAVSTLEKVEVVKGYVKDVMEVIETRKKQQFDDEVQQANARKPRQPESTITFPSCSPSVSYSPSVVDLPSSRSFLSDDTEFSTDSPAAASETTYSDDRVPDSKSNSLDYTSLPSMLDKKLDEWDTQGHLKSTIVKASQDWQLKRQANLLVKATTHSLSSRKIESERNKAMDLLDALSRSGSLAIESSELHVLIGATHCFEHSIMTTLVEDNVNPIVKAELSTLLLGSTIYGEPAAGLLGNETDVSRLAPSMPALFGLDAVEQVEA